jgi:hypothetical protein
MNRSCPTVRPTELRCSCCRRWLPDHEFRQNRRYPHRRCRSYYCNACTHAYRRAAAPDRHPANRAMVRPGWYRCARCRKVLGADAFSWFRRRGRTSLERTSYCRACVREKNRESRVRRYLRLAQDPAAQERERQQNRRRHERAQQRAAAERQRRTSWVVEQTRRYLAAGWTVTALAAALGVSRHTVARWRNGGPASGVQRAAEERWCQFLREAGHDGELRVWASH